MARYKVVEGSQSYHCCFRATVVDTTQPQYIDEAKTVQYKDQFEPICECLEIEDANRICEALNGLS